MFYFFSFYSSFHFFFNFFFKVFNFSNIFKNSYFYLNFYKNWYNKNLFLKKKNSISEINYSSFLKFYHKTKDSYFLSSTALDASSNTNLNLVDYELAEIQKDSILELKKNFLGTIKQNRQLLSFFFFKKTKRQKTITKQFYYFKTKKQLCFTKLNLFFLLLSSQLVFTYYDAFYLISNNCVFVNHISIVFYKNFNMLKNGDFVSIILSKHYYFYYFSFFEHINVIKFKLYKKVLSLRKNSLNFYKQKSMYYSNKFNLFNQINLSVPAYLEVDFFTLSFFVLNFSFFFKFYPSLFSPFLYKSYNWGFTS